MAGNRDYNAFTRNLRERYGISQASARKVYFAARDKVGRAPRGTDVGKHPRITKKLTEESEPKRGRREKIRKEPPKRVPPKPPPKREPPKKRPPKKPPKKAPPKKAPPKKQPPKPPAPTEYVVSADYRRRRPGHAVSTQISIFVDAGVKVTRASLKSAIREFAKTGEQKQGYEVVPIFWQHQDKQTEVNPNEADAFRNVLQRSDIRSIRKSKDVR